MKVCIVWHMHQPDYRPPEGGRSVMPWVRLHAAKDYMDMARLVEAAPDSVRVVMNLVPCLLDQLDDLARGVLDDELLAVSRKDPKDLTEEERAFALRHLFAAHEERQIRALPRYADLFERRNQARAAGRSTRGFSDQDFRDLAVLFHLAWSGTFLRREPEVGRLLAKGKGFSEDEKRALLEAQAAQARAIVPLYRKLRDEGRLEVSTTPLYHPILPLLHDLATATESRQGCSTGGVAFRHPEDARAQVALGLERAERHLGKRPVGMWPSEGSLSEPVLELLGREGVAWCGGDEQILRRSLGPRAGHAPHLRPWRFGDGPAAFFRDTALSDLIGFTYSRRDAGEAAQDFLARLRRTAAQAEGREEPVVSVILDGENAWEHYAENGTPFLSALYRALGTAKDLEATTPSRVLRNTTPEVLDRLSPGSWIHGNFDTWAGHDEKNRAWALLSAVRREVEDAKGQGPLAAGVTETLYRAEGSDWFWWLGDDHPTDYLSEFESLFRRNLGHVCRLLGRRPVAGLDEPIPRRGPRAHAVEPPYALIAPRIDGRAESYYAWVGSGVLRPDDGGSMRLGTPPVVHELRFGFDARRLYLRLVPPDERRLALAQATLVLTLAPREGPPRRFTSRPGAALEDDAGRPVAGAEAASGRVRELALPRDQAGLAPGARVGLAIELSLPEGTRERVPRDGELELAGPDDAFDLRHWTL